MLDNNWRNLTNAYIKGQLDRDHRLLQLRQLIPREFRLPKPQEIPSIFKALREAIWEDRA